MNPKTIPVDDPEEVRKTCKRVQEFFDKNSDKDSFDTTDLLRVIQGEDNLTEHDNMVLAWLYGKCQGSLFHDIREISEVFIKDYS